MSTTSRLPATIDALVAAVTPVIGATVNVVDGPPLSWQTLALAQGAVTQSGYLFIGAQPNDDGGDAAQDFNAAGAVSRDEQITVWCGAYANSGDQVMKTARDAAFGIVAAVEQAIRTDPTLGNAVLYSRVDNSGKYHPRQTKSGCDVFVVFSVAARAYLN